MKTPCLLLCGLLLLMCEACDDELVAMFPECHINRTGTLQVGNKCSQDYELYLDTHYAGVLEPGDVRYFTYPARSGVNVRMQELDFDSIPRICKGQCFVTECDTAIFSALP